MSAKVANLLAGECRHECAKTWRYEHGGSLPGGPFPGTMADPGDVRRCEHGRIWRFVGVRQDGFFNDFDRWQRVSRLVEPLIYRRAMRLLASTGDTQ